MSAVIVTEEDAPCALYRNVGDGTFVREISGPVASLTGIAAAAWLDADGDGELDIVWMSRESPCPPCDGSIHAQVLLNTGRGRDFQRAEHGLDLARWSSPYEASFVPADYDGDGRVDLLVLMSQNGWGVLRNNGSGFEATSIGTDYSSLASFGRSVSTKSGSWGDFDGDGYACGS